MIVCPKCKNDNQSMIETRNHRREQMDCFCQICAYSWIEYFKNIPKMEIIPGEILKEVKK